MTRGASDRSGIIGMPHHAAMGIGDVYLISRRLGLVSPFPYPVMREAVVFKRRHFFSIMMRTWQAHAGA